MQRKNGSVYWETPVQADGKGFPDLLLVRKKVMLAFELKVGRNKASKDQQAWLHDLYNAGATCCMVVTPKDWDWICGMLE